MKLKPKELLTLVGIIGIVLMMVLPLPTVLLDIFFGH